MPGLDPAKATTATPMLTLADVFSAAGAGALPAAASGSSGEDSVPVRIQGLVDWQIRVPGAIDDVLLPWVETFPWSRAFSAFNLKPFSDLAERLRVAESRLTGLDIVAHQRVYPTLPFSNLNNNMFHILTTDLAAAELVSRFDRLSETLKQQQERYLTVENTERARNPQASSLQINRRITLLEMLFITELQFIVRDINHCLAAGSPIKTLSEQATQLAQSYQGLTEKALSRDERTTHLDRERALNFCQGPLRQSAWWMDSIQRLTQEAACRTTASNANDDDRDGSSPLMMPLVRAPFASAHASSAGLPTPTGDDASKPSNPLAGRDL